MAAGGVADAARARQGDHPAGELPSGARAISRHEQEEDRHKSVVDHSSSGGAIKASSCRRRGSENGLVSSARGNRPDDRHHGGGDRVRPPAAPAPKRWIAVLGSALHRSSTRPLTSIDDLYRINATMTGPGGQQVYRHIRTV
jgi:hypothetical protein